MLKMTFATSKHLRLALPKIKSKLLIRIKVEKIDKREFLDIDIEKVKERWPTALIFPEHRPKAITQSLLLDQRRGPGHHDPIYDLTEKRTDIVLF